MKKTCELCGKNNKLRNICAQCVKKGIGQLNQIPRMIISNKIFCEKCNKKYALSRYQVIPGTLQDGWLEEWLLICPKKHKFTMDKEDMRAIEYNHVQKRK